MMSEVWWQHSKATGGKKGAGTLLEMHMIEFSPYCEQSSNEHFCSNTVLWGYDQKMYSWVIRSSLFSFSDNPTLISKVAAMLLYQQWVWIGLSPSFPCSCYLRLHPSLRSYWQVMAAERGRIAVLWRGR